MNAVENGEGDGLALQLQPGPEVYNSEDEQEGSSCNLSYYLSI